MSAADFVKRRPTEAITGPGAAPFVYAYLVDQGWDPLLALLVALAAAALPAGISEAIDAIRQAEGG
jgi:hypothetical protein